MRALSNGVATERYCFYSNAAFSQTWCGDRQTVSDTGNAANFRRWRENSHCGIPILTRINDTSIIICSALSTNHSLTFFIIASGEYICIGTDT